MTYRTFMRTKALSRALILLVSILTSSLSTADISDTSFYRNFASTQFVNQDGQAFKPEQYLGKVVLFNFIYTTCSTTCPIQTRQLVSINNALSNVYRDKIEMISISVDTQYDKPSVLKQYAHTMKAEANNLQFLSGSYNDIKTLQDKLYLFGNPANPAHPKVDISKLKTEAKEEVLGNHMTILWVVDKKGQLLQRYSAYPMDVKRVERELKLIADM
jgi:protein SCO1